MAASKEFVLYDLASKKNVCTSPNVWRVRQVLDFKNIEYRTVFLELPKIAPFGRSVNLPPNEGPEKPFTVPILQFPDGSHVMHSNKIVEALVKYQPEPKLDLGDFERVRAILRNLMQPLFPIYGPEGLELFHPESRAHWAKSVAPPGEDLEEWLGKQDRHAAWVKAEPAIEEVRKLLDEKSGPFINGDKESYADMVLAASWLTDEAVCPDVLAELEKRVPAITAHLKACRPWHGKNQ